LRDFGPSDKRNLETMYSIFALHEALGRGMSGTLKSIPLSLQVY
jgi:hypothetical protein